MRDEQWRDGLDGDRAQRAVKEVPAGPVPLYDG